ncbi:MAG: EbsA family protein [Furfurilactobacillus sp.]|uniref:EbsA family protein n=1 Tax=Furfurilactobacillus sp. TaxID=2767911 RepID=UPI00258A162D|nr:EbsA family protein [Furfurilactobacillus sp.]MCH4010695.1 EbsA family protein [Furfurilactobacillus sp.]MCH4036587.1 EbsA family protein [Furfurilactobacillus sp.]MCH4114467.1 EbsA family protein [Furfurilactobacillus sp.]MCH4132710.1 EbsA family protein [Furfurilactobacillus sp.]MCI1340710.1 EbsA family protein [Furfurilactobacillus sp.]
MHTQRFFYRPSGLTAVIIWSWVAIFFCGGVIFQYEMARFNWPAIIIACLFVLLLTWELLGRQLVFTGQNLIVRRMLAPRALTVNVHQLEQLSLSGRTMSFSLGGKHYRFRVTKHALAKIKTIVSAD